MANNINYISHTTFDPSFYLRRFEFDLPKTWKEDAGRALLIVLPYLSLHKPTGNAISVVMGSVRCVSSFSETVGELSANDKKIFYILGKAGQTTLAIIALSATVFNFQLGLLVTTSADITLSLVHVLQHLAAHEWKLAAEEAAQTLSSSLYLALMLNGSLELVLASLLLQAAINFAQSWSEVHRADRMPEAVAKFVMGSIRLYQSHQTFQQLQTRNLLLTQKKFADLMQRISKGRNVVHLIGSPLENPGEEVILTNSEGKSFHFGTHVHGYGKGAVKGMNVQFRQGTEKTELEFKVNHVFRDRLEKLVQELNQMNKKELHEFIKLTNSHATNVRIEQIPYRFSNETDQEMGTACRITLEGLGSISFGNTSDYPNLYDKIKIEVDKDKTLYQMHELLSFFNLDDALKASSLEDIERLKMGQLFRVFYPREATLFEREEAFFNLTAEQLKSEMIKKAPQMQQTFDEYLPKMQLEEILPGKLRYSIKGLSEKLYEAGGRSLVSTITGPDNEVFARTASVLKMGMLAPEVRYSNGIAAEGLSLYADFYSGGGDSVYTQLLTEKNFHDEMSLDYLYWGKVRILFSLDVLETGTYQYHTDALGWRRLMHTDPEFERWLPDWNPYLDRPAIIDFVKEEQHRSHPGHEVMVKERIDPSKIQGLIVPTEKVKNQLLTYFKEKNLVQVNAEGIETILNIPIARFIHVGRELSENWL